MLLDQVECAIELSSCLVVKSPTGASLTNCTEPVDPLAKDGVPLVIGQPPRAGLAIGVSERVQAVGNDYRSIGSAWTSEAPQAAGTGGNAR